MVPSKKTALITDLDNTLFDWVDLWYRCFSAMLDQIVSISNVPKDTLLPEISTVHQRHGTSEYSFLIDELPSLKPMLDGRPAIEVFGAAIEAYREQRQRHLTLFDTVADTLLKIKGRGALIIGYTESMAFYSNYRVRRLGLDGVLDHIFCPEDHILPSSIDTSSIRKYPAEHYKFRYSTQKFTPKGSKKPDKEVLNAIILAHNLKKEECVYVGDNLMKDVAMAVECGVDAVWAKYGQAHKRAEYKLLQEVTHWTPEEVANEQRIKENKDVHPNCILEVSYSQILDSFKFGDFHAR